MDLSRRGFLGGLLASAAAAVLKVTPKADEADGTKALYNTSTVFLVFDLHGSLTMRFELSDDEVRYLRDSSPPLGVPVPDAVADLREHMLLRFLTANGFALTVQRGGRDVYRKRFECDFAHWHQPTLPKPGRSVHRCLRNVDLEQGRMDEKRWRELVGDVNDATRIQ